MTAALPSAPDGRARIAILFGVTLAFFLPTIWSFREAWASPSYAHGWVVALATVWLVWRERSALRLDGSDLHAALPVLAALSFLWLCATAMSVRSVAQGALPLTLLAWSAATFGRATARRLAPIATFALLAVPVWEITVPPLQAMTTWASGLAVRAVGVPAVITGNLVEIEAGSFLIAGGCAGLNYLLAGLTIGGLYAQIFTVGWRAGVGVLALAAGLSIVGNWIRVATIIVIGHVSRMQSGLVDDHLMLGWAIFVVGLFAFFPLGRRMERRDAGSGRPEGPTAGLRGTETRVPAAAVAALVAVAGPLVYYLGSTLPAREPPSPELTASTEWRRETAETSVRPTGWLPAFGGAVEHVTETWSDGARLLLTDRLMYRGQSQGAELIGYDNRIAPDTALVAERLMGPIGPRRRLVNEAIVREGDEDYRLVWYWYRVAGVETESAARAKLLELWAFATVSRVSELVAVSTPCDGDSCVQASEALSGFLGGT